MTRVYLERRVYHDTDEHENENLVTYMEHILDINKCTSIEAHLSHHLSAFGRLSIYNPEYQLSLTIIYVEELTCPAGFLLSQLKRECVCNKLLLTYKISNCNIDNTSITIPNSTWLGIVSVNQNKSILYHNGNATFGYAPACLSYWLL